MISDKACSSLFPLNRGIEGVFSLLIAHCSSLFPLNRGTEGVSGDRGVFLLLVLSLVNRTIVVEVV